MADMKESALTQQSDCKWVRALDSNGNSILISKEDLAAVVGGLLPSYFKKYITIQNIGSKSIKITIPKGSNQSVLYEIMGSNGYTGLAYIYKKKSEAVPSIKNVVGNVVKGKYIDDGNNIVVYLIHNSIFLTLLIPQLYGAPNLETFEVIEFSDIPSEGLTDIVAE